MFLDFPSAASWWHGGARSGFEACSFVPAGGGWVISGSTTAVEANAVWWVSYELEIDASWTTTRAVITGKRGARALDTTVIEGDGAGQWMVNGRANPQLDGCLDVDLESSAMTNALPVRRLRPAVGESMAAPAAYVRVDGLSVERLEQGYLRCSDGDDDLAFDYEAPAFDFRSHIEYDSSGLVVHYPGVAERFA